MPVIKVWGLPQTEKEKLIELRQDLMGAVLNTKELGIESERDIACRFPSDMMNLDLETKIIVEITGLFEKPNQGARVHQELARKVGEVVHQLFSSAELVEVFVNPFPIYQGFWTSRKPAPEFQPGRAFRQIERAFGMGFQDRHND